MADVDFDDFEGGYLTPPAQNSRFGHMVNLAGAACSVALVVGLGLWGYKLAVRDVTGVPVMRALIDPMRIAPENPGGDVISHQGLSVNAVAAVGTAAALPDELVLAPRPVELLADDVAGLALAADEATDGLEPVAEAPLDPSALAVVTEVPESQEDAVALALAEALADGGADVESLPDDLATVQSGPVSIRPMARPTDVVLASAQTGDVTAVQQVAAVAPIEIDPTTLAVGTRLVQLGAYDDRAEAGVAWSNLAGQFGELMVGKAMVIQSAQSGGRTFYRLRAHGFEGEDDARRFCSALLAENAACIPVAHR